VSRRLLLLVATVLWAGCAAAPPDDASRRPECRNPNPPDADCSYAFDGLAAIARFNETYELERARAAVEAENYTLRVANERAIIAERGDEDLTVEAREGWFWFVLGKDTQGVHGLTEAEANAAGVRLCADGAGAEMERLLAAFESRTGWTRATWEPCRANISVA
jgi:hypothetical protein